VGVIRRKSGHHQAADAARVGRSAIKEYNGGFHHKGVIAREHKEKTRETEFRTADPDFRDH